MVRCPRCDYDKVWSDAPKFEKNGNIVLHCECQNIECHNKWTGHYELVETKEK
jgi:hypothetical protein